MQRRDFITTWLRYLLLVLLGAVSIIALFKSKGADNTGCPSGNLCSSCQKLKGCSLPQKAPQTQRS